jgi:hypothetical protein
MFSELNKRLEIQGMCICIEDVIWKGDNIGFMYRVVSTEDRINIECASLVITHAIEYNIHNVEQPVLHIRDIIVHQDYRTRGIARLLLFYGLSHAIVNCQDIRYSDLEDDTDFPYDKPGNLYYFFGYRFKEGDFQEKWLDLEEFKKNQIRFLSCCILKP